MILQAAMKVFSQIVCLRKRRRHHRRQWIQRLNGGQRDGLIGWPDRAAALLLHERNGRRLLPGKHLLPEAGRHCSEWR